MREESFEDDDSSSEVDSVSVDSSIVDELPIVNFAAVPTIFVESAIDRDYESACESYRIAHRRNFLVISDEQAFVLAVMAIRQNDSDNLQYWLANFPAIIGMIYEGNPAHGIEHGESLMNIAGFLKSNIEGVHTSPASFAEIIRALQRSGAVIDLRTLFNSVLTGNEGLPGIEKDHLDDEEFFPGYMLTALIRCGADVNVRDAAGNNVLHLAMTNHFGRNLLEFSPNNFSVVDKLKELEEDGYGDLMDERELFFRIMQLVRAGVYLDHPNNAGITPREMINTFCSRGDEYLKEVNTRLFREAERSRSSSVGLPLSPAALEAAAAPAEPHPEAAGTDTAAVAVSTTPGSREATLQSFLERVDRARDGASDSKENWTDRARPRDDSPERDAKKPRRGRSPQR